MGEGRLRDAARLALVAGAAASILLMMRAGSQQRSALLILLFSGWVLSPFLALAVANARSAGVRPELRAAIAVASIAVAVFAISLYGFNAVRPSFKAGFLYLVGPAAQWLLIAIVTAAATALARR